MTKSSPTGPAKKGHFSAEDIATDLGISRSKAYEIMRQMRAERRR